MGTVGVVKKAIRIDSPIQEGHYDCDSQSAAQAHHNTQHPMFSIHCEVYHADPLVAHPADCRQALLDGGQVSTSTLLRIDNVGQHFDYLFSRFCPRHRGTIYFFQRVDDVFIMQGDVWLAKRGA